MEGEARGKVPNQAGICRGNGPTGTAVCPSAVLHILLLPPTSPAFLTHAERCRQATTQPTASWRTHHSSREHDRELSALPNCVFHHSDGVTSGRTHSVRRARGIRDEHGVGCLRHPGAICCLIRRLRLWDRNEPSTSSPLRLLAVRSIRTSCASRSLWLRSLHLCRR